MARSARRQTVRATCSAAPAGVPPARMKRRSGGMTASYSSIQRSSRATSSIETAAFVTRPAMRCDGSARRAPTANRSRWICWSCVETSPPGRCAQRIRARRSARRRRHRRRHGHPTSARGCRRRAPCPPNRPSWYKFSPAQLFHFTLANDPNARCPNPPARSPQPDTVPLPLPNARRLFRRRLLDWYRRNGRDLPWRHTRNPYHILVSEVMLQQTQVDRVLPKYEEWLENFRPSKRLRPPTKTM